MAEPRFRCWATPLHFGVSRIFLPSLTKRRSSLREAFVSLTVREMITSMERGLMVILCTCCRQSSQYLVWEMLTQTIFGRLVFLQKALNNSKKVSIAYTSMLEGNCLVVPQAVS